MPRIIRILTASLLAAGLCAAGGATAMAASGTGVQPAADCTSTVPVAMTPPGFVPSSVAPGQTSNLTGSLTNCTSQPVTIQEQITWLWLGTVQNCFVSDPYYQVLTIPANGSISLNSGTLVPPACTASGEQATVKITNTNGNLLAQATAVLGIEQPMPVVACHVAYSVQSQWQGGFTAAISISNTGQVAFGGWTLTFTFGGDQKLGTVWGASGTQSGNIVTLKNASYDSTIAPGQTITGIGFTGTWTNSNAAPTGFNLNGTLCS